MCRKSIYLISFVLVLALATVTHADWIAYNDLLDGNGGTAARGLNVTTHTYLDTNKALIDFDTGATLTVTMTGEIVGDGDANGDAWPNNGGNCAAGTDADNVFGGTLDLTGGNELDGTSEHKAIIFNGLNPAMSYTITLTSNRASSSYTSRWTKVTIEGADAYTYAASAGVVKLSEESGKFCTGYNTVTGYVMKWTDISCGADGSFSIKSENAGHGDKGYAMIAFKLEGLSSTSAADPSPADEVTDVPRDVTLSWKPGVYADKHNVYLGTNFNDVNDASRTNPLGVLVSQNQVPDSYSPAAVLEWGQTYYWRVDEVNAPPDLTIFKGEVWQFTVEPFAYPIANITATASSQFSASTGPQNTINGSGLDDNDLHSTNETAIWLSSMTGSQPTWIQYEFDRVYKLHQMWVWNNNTAIEPIVGFGFKDVTIEYSSDGVSWATLGTTAQFARAPGTPGYAHNTTVDLSSVVAKYVKLTANSNWGGILPQYSLSEVRFFYVPVVAREPNPASGSTDMAVDNVTVSWRAGREAAKHNLYLSDSNQAVIDGTAPVTTVSQVSYGPLSLDLGKSYYWRVDEVNEAKTPTTWQGNVWNFTTQQYFVVDSFEDYNDFQPDRIFDTWIDGWANPANGSQVGYANPPFAERSVIHGGKQSMPLSYDNTAGATYSEAERTFAAPQNWTEHGIKTLSLWFCGAASNVAGQLYVKVNGSKVTYDGDVSNLTRGSWQPWNINLSAFGGLGVSLQRVTKLSIGIDGSGAKGTLYLDDIRLYPYDRQLISPVEPDKTRLVGHWKFDGDTQDSSGRGNHGRSGVTPAAFVAGKVGSNALNFRGADYVAIDGVDDDVTSTNLALSAWVKTTQISKGDLFALNDNASGHPLEFYVNIGYPGRYDGGDVTYTTAPRVADGQWHHMTLVRSGNTGYIYVDGILAVSYASTFSLATVTRWSIGQEWDDSTPSDFYNGAVDDARIYNYGLSYGEVGWLAGWAKPFDKPF